MSFSNAMDLGLAKLLFNGVGIANLADNAAAAPAGTFYLSLHTADPGKAGTQATNEATYAGYVRQPVARGPAGFTITGGRASLTSAIEFPEGASSVGNVTHWAIGLSPNGAGLLIASGSTDRVIPTGNGVVPRLKVGTYVEID